MPTNYPLLANKTDLAAYLFVDVIELSDQVDRLLQRASEKVIILIRKNYISTNETHIESAKLATCAEVEAWLTFDESVSISSGLESLSLGTFSITLSKSGSVKDPLSPRANKYLNDAGLLYAGLNQRRRGWCDESS